MSSNSRGKDKEKPIGDYIIDSYKNHIRECCAILILLGLLFMAVGHFIGNTAEGDSENEGNQFWSALFISIGGASIGAGTVSLVFRAAIVALANKELIKESIDETYNRVLFTSIPKFRVEIYNSELTIKEDPENPGKPMMEVRDIRTLVNLHERTVSQKKEKMKGVPAEQEFNLRNVKIIRHNREENSFSGDGIKVRMKTVTPVEGEILKEYEYITPFGCTIGKDEVVTIDEKYTLSPCIASEEKQDCFGFTLLFPCEKLIVKMTAKDKFYFKDVEAKIHDCFTNEDIEVKKGPDFICENGHIKEITWELTPDVIIQEDACDIYFKLIKVDADES